MSVRPHPTKGEGWWVIDYYPAGRKGKEDDVSISGEKRRSAGFGAGAAPITGGDKYSRFAPGQGPDPGKARVLT